MVLGYKKFTIIVFSNAGRGGSKKFKSISTLPRGVELKSYSIPASPPLWGGENPHGAKQGGVG